MLQPDFDPRAEDSPHPLVQVRLEVQKDALPGARDPDRRKG